MREKLDIWLTGEQAFEEMTLKYLSAIELRAWFRVCDLTSAAWLREEDDLCCHVS